MKIFNYFAKKVKGNDFELDENIDSKYLFILIKTMGINFVRGKFKTLGLKKRGSIIFCGKNTKLLSKKNMIIGNKVNIGNYVVIDALSKNNLYIGNNVKIADFTSIKCTGSIKSVGKGFKIGNECGIGENCFFGAAGGIEIGNDVIMGQNVRFHSENHNYNDLEILIRKQGVSNKGIKIGNNCWIGSGVIFLDGAEIGDGCVVAANSIINKRFENNIILAGSPARVIKERGKDE